MYNIICLVVYITCSSEIQYVMLNLSTVVQETLRETKSYPSTDYYGSLKRKFSSPTLNLLRRTKSSIKILRDRSEWQLATCGCWYEE